MTDTVVVIDYGSKTFKAGFNYAMPPFEDEPRILTPNAVQIYKPSSSAAAAAKAGGPVEVASSDAHGELMGLMAPVVKGQIHNFDGLESLLHYTLYDLLGWNIGFEGAVMVCEPLLTPRSDREQLAQLLFEQFNVEGVFFQDQATCSLYSIGKLTGCVVDIGHGKVDVATVMDGQVGFQGLHGVCALHAHARAQCARRSISSMSSHGRAGVARGRVGLLAGPTHGWCNAARLRTPSQHSGAQRNTAECTAQAWAAQGSWFRMHGQLGVRRAVRAATAQPHLL